MSGRISTCILALLLIFSSSDSAFAQSQKKTAYGILLDNTRSLEKKFQHVLVLGKAVVRRIRERGPISLFSFRTNRNEGGVLWNLGETSQAREGYGVATARLDIEGSQDADVLSRYIDGLSVVGGQTDLFESISSIAKELQAKVDYNKNSLGDKTIILITDGAHVVRVGNDFIYDADNYSRRIQLRQLIKELKERGIKVYAIGLIRELSAYGGFRFTEKENAESFLKKITKETGGRVVFPKSSTIDEVGLLNELLAQ